MENMGKIPMEHTGGYLWEGQGEVLWHRGADDFVVFSMIG